MSKSYISRDAEKDLHAWLQRKSRCPLILRGARQVGKSTLVREFARKKKLILHEVNLERHVHLNSLFGAFDTRRILREIENIVGQGPIVAGGTLLFLDEIQATPQAIAALRYLAEDHPDLPVIAAGSLLEFALSDHSFSMPVGRVEYACLGPLRFGEFLDARNEERLRSYLCGFGRLSDHSEFLHDTLLQQLRDFLIVGGMPGALRDFLETNDLREATRVHRMILRTFADDFAKYARGEKLRVLQRVLDFVPATVGTKCKYVNISREWKSREIRAAIDLLSLARVIHPVHHTSAASPPIKIGSNESVFKSVFLDAGLMNASLGTERISLQDFAEQTFAHEGRLAEQFVGQHLLYSNEIFAEPALYYWLREGKKNNAEVDYLVEHKGGVVAVEVKSGTSGSLRSLHQYMALRNQAFAVRFDLNPPSMQEVKQIVITPKGQKSIAYTLLSLPLYFVEQFGRLCRVFGTDS